MLTSILVFKTDKALRRRPKLTIKSALCLVLLISLFSQGCSLVFSRGKQHKPRESRLKTQKKIKKRSRYRKTRKKSVRKIFSWPVKGVITSKYGMRRGKKHDGLDIAAKRGTAIYAVGMGKVIFSGWGPSGYGKMIILKHSSKYVTVYAHNSKNIVSLGDKVIKGEKIGYVGKSGRATGPHLHFEVRVNLMPRDPLLYLPKPVKKTGKKRSI